MSITTIAFDGMHRCGKGTQIKLLQNRCNHNNIYNLSVRGEHYRDGNGLDTITDPKSLWRQTHKTSLDYEMKSNRLHRELYYFYTKFLPQHLKKIGVEKAIVIQDRSLVGKYMFDASIDQNFTNTETVQFGKHENMKRDIIIPDIIFVLQPTQAELLNRLEKGFDPKQENAVFRHAYKQDYIKERYNDYYNGLALVPTHIQDRIYHIKGDQADIEIQKEILDILQSKNIF